MSPSQPAFTLPRLYSLFFLSIEPLATLAGAYYAYVHPATYLSLTHTQISSTPLSSIPSPLPLSTAIALTQLANLYLAFALNEALVLRSTADLRVWRTLLFGLLVADFGHLWSVNALGMGVYWRIWEWNCMAWGNVGFVYVGALMRMCFLGGVGMGGRGGGKVKE
ncbi:hypothetical protein LOCC1_G002336 [Lachnellula occidentalis]|uniref:DUF7704 domain-containing protein n=1 Tax=Lachnellula occidentalis TaxID=215460 RepID=A0A8H8S3Y2_9HELO|nr:hypothetical protein LOCC1_G002336 [Lachnellula occidentalis]